MQPPKRQNVYIRKLRPQSVLDGAIVPNEEFPDLLAKPSNGFHTSNVSNSVDSSEKCKVQHLTKLRPRNRKTRAPTRVTLIEPKSVEQNAPSKLDEGLDNFFPSPSLTCKSNSSIEIKEPSLSSIKESPNGHKPQPQPRKILKKIGFKSQTDQSNMNDYMHKQQSIDSSTIINLKNDELTRSSSPTMLSKHVSICSDVDGRVHSPVPSGDLQQHNEFLAEIKAKQEKRSHASTPINEQLTFANTLDNLRRTSPENIGQSDSKPILEHNNNNINNSYSVVKRATIFGELHKSPSKGSINQNSNGTHPDEVSQTNGSNSTAYSSVKQRPKSMVGILGAKFELSLMNSNGSHK